MHVRLRLFGKPETIVVVESKLTKIEQFRRIIKDKLGVDTQLQRLFYGGKLLEDGYTFHDYNIKLNDVIQLMVRIQPQESTEIEKTEPKSNEVGIDNNDLGYKDADSILYAVGDLIDVRDREQGAWFEAKIVRIVCDEKLVPINTKDLALDSKSSSGNTTQEDKENDLENNINKSSEDSPSDTKKNGILKYFNKATTIVQKKQIKMESNIDTSIDAGILYKIQFDADEEDSNIYCKLSEIRPRARTVIDVKDLKVGQKVMINYNTDEPLQKGYWYDFMVCEIKPLRSGYELIGTLYLGSESVPQNDTKIKIHDKIYAIDEVVPLKERTEEYKKMMVTQTEKRSLPLKCLTCHDNEDTPCKDCGCFLCSGKELPEKTVLCDECNKGYHMKCLEPPLTELPEEDWYCPTCKRDPNNVVAPGAAKQVKKAVKSKRDWGRGMACVGKTKTCAMPPNHFGPIPGIEVGMCWRFRIQLSESGVHRPPVSGIHGRDVDGAYSIVLSGGYEDDVDHGNEFTYTGSGGRDLSGNRRTAEQSCDQILTRENRALARNCAIKQISEDGGDAGENWKSGKPVRVVRSYKMLKHFPKYAPKEGIRYDGIYKVVKYYPEKGISGFRVWKYLLRRDDPSPAPWEPGAKQYPIIYPDGFLEAEAEKKAQKEKNIKNTKGSKKRSVKKKSESDSEHSPSPKKCKLASIFTARSPKVTKLAKEAETTLSAEDQEIIKADTLNSKLWDECLEICKSQGKKEFIEHVTQVFLCIICQEVPASPVTTPCLHNFCIACLKHAFKSTGSEACPCCRQSLCKYTPQLNDRLKTALRSVMPGYDAKK